ncbi:hypothetical protein B0F87_11550 [Methylobacter tundripaludum]|uniref:Uncharacterized protein n=1 Tax=Methylobacter tundripaludum TaxID=173365 RepID=A0A2S6H693_9GAMM|nr:hypothetical protein B0F87_11550 [Methylobacter tundripaludum]
MELGLFHTRITIIWRWLTANRRANAMNSGSGFMCVTVLTVPNVRIKLYFSD